MLFFVWNVKCNKSTAHNIHSFPMFIFPNEIFSFVASPAMLVNGWELTLLLCFRSSPHVGFYADSLSSTDAANFRFLFLLSATQHSPVDTRVKRISLLSTNWQNFSIFTKLQWFYITQFALFGTEDTENTDLVSQQIGSRSEVRRMKR